MSSTGLVLNIQATLLTFSAEVQNVFNVLTTLQLKNSDPQKYTKNE